MRPKENNSLKLPFLGSFFIFMRIRNVFCALVFLLSTHLQAQQTIIKQFQTKQQYISINTEGLDEITILNTNNNTVEITLLDENAKQHLIYTDEAAHELTIGFSLFFSEDNNGVFRKFITQRLNRASVVIKLPKNKDISVFGSNIDVISKNYNGNLQVFIDKGHVDLHSIQQKATVKLFQGNVYGKISDGGISIITTKGTIKVDDESFLKTYQKKQTNTTKIFELNSINANVFITTQ